jgi:hypothetical protein
VKKNTTLDEGLKRQEGGTGRNQEERRYLGEEFCRKGEGKRWLFLFVLLVRFFFNLYRQRKTFGLSWRCKTALEHLPSPLLRGQSAGEKSLKLVVVNSSLLLKKKKRTRGLYIKIQKEGVLFVRSFIHSFVHSLSDSPGILC